MRRIRGRETFRSSPRANRRYDHGHLWLDSVMERAAPNWKLSTDALRAKEDGGGVGGVRGTTTNERPKVGITKFGSV